MAGWVDDKSKTLPRQGATSKFLHNFCEVAQNPLFNFVKDYV
jgi:hypothetical protein